ncbi:MAG: FkbM family methyltransferase [Verrucomicrobiota bacterium]
MTLIQYLDGVPAFHLLVRWLRLRQFVHLLLKIHPLNRTLPGSGVRYRCRDLETVGSAHRIFVCNNYGKVIDPKTTRTFVDLGCNVGLFGALLAHETGCRDLRGLMIDANPAMIDETRWLLATNDLDRVAALHGLVGAAGDGDTAEFYLLPSHLGSSQFPVYDPGKPPKGNWRKLAVPRIDLEAAWQERFGDVRCHLLKVNIEGSEEKLFRAETMFLRRVDRIVVQWHKWLVSRESMEETLRSQGLALVEVLRENDSSGNALYQRT